MSKKALKGVLYWIVIQALCAANVSAQENKFSFKALLMPGQVIEGHAEYEQVCSNCHETFSNASQNDLCLDCHKDVAQDLIKGLGFHGKVANAQDVQCNECHSEHLGRQGDIVKIDIDNFDHNNTDFELIGEHTNVSCKSCHLDDLKYRAAPKKCVDCHKADDRHEGAFPDTCQDCHNAQSWSDTRFDHDTTKFALKGLHQEVKCNACHPDEKYQNTPTTCVACHLLNDVHGGQNGNECENCHSVMSLWTKSTFKHDTDTNFKLQGGHKDISCNSCHQGSVFKKELSTECVSCHRKDDQHHAQNGTKCGSCHVDLDWAKVTFNHSSDTQYPLVGLHQDVSCLGCHREGTKEPLKSTACIDCHQVDDIHKTQLGEQCDTCHSPEGWREDIRFNHELSRFPLVGMHAVTNCDSCHSSKMYTDAGTDAGTDTGSDCISCHAKDDFHSSTLGPNCGNCHNPNDWRLWIFDHNAQTDFSLDGAHEGLNCAECHFTPSKDKIDLDSQCVTCHAPDDVHNRRFGKACDRCHTTSSFSQIQMQ